MKAMTKPLSPEELMKPRYEVWQEGYPNMIFFSGQIITLDRIDKETNQPFYELANNDKWYDLYFDRYPTIFRKLEWWEKREAEEMPDYVKLGKGEDSVVYKWGVDVKLGLLADGAPFGLKFKNGGGLLVEYLLDQNFLPATEADYLSQQNNKNNDKD